MPEDGIFVAKNLGNALIAREWPAITTYNRLEGRPRTLIFDRALKAEVRDALWMLTRQWQLGEFQGDDAGSPLLTKLALERTELTRYRPREGETQTFDDTIPLEARVERRPIPLRQGDRTIALDLRLLMGRQWLKLIADIADYRAEFLAAYPIVAPDPALPEDADRAAHPEAWQDYAAVAGRSLDGGALYEHLIGAPGRHPYDGVAGIDPGDHGALDDRADAFVAWFARLLAPPPAADEDAWDASRLEYRFSTSAPTQPAGEKVYVAEEYHGGHLDWWAFDVDPAADGLRDPADPPDPTPVQVPPRTVIPAGVVFEGMPNTRWWAFEDRRTNFGEVNAATTDLAKLLFLEFGLVYANDWFLVPIDLPTGSIARVRGLSVTNVFGERTWVEPAGAGPDDAWQRWSMFTVNTLGEDGEADVSLLLAPTVPKIQEGDPIEEVMLVRDEMANMVWGVERTVPLPSGEAKRGAEAGRETLSYLRRLATPPGPVATERVADVRYEAMTSVPEQWIPFIPAHVPGDNREIQLQRASLPRPLEGLPPAFARVRPRTALLREGIDAHRSYVVHEEEVPRSGTVVEQSYQRSRWRGGRTVVWLGVRRQTGRGEGSSGLAFDQLVDVPDEG